MAAIVYNINDYIVHKQTKQLYKIVALSAYDRVLVSDVEDRLYRFWVKKSTLTNNYSYLSGSNDMVRLLYGSKVKPRRAK